MLSEHNEELAPCTGYRILFSVTKYQLKIFSADLPAVQFSIFNAKIKQMSHTKICSQFSSLSAFQSGKHFKLSYNTKNTICTNTCLSPFSMSRYENETVFQKSVLQDTNTDKRLIFTTVTFPPNHIFT